MIIVSTEVCIHLILLQTETSNFIY